MFQKPVEEKESACMSSTVIAAGTRRTPSRAGTGATTRTRMPAAERSCSLSAGAVVFPLPKAAQRRIKERA